MIDSAHACSFPPPPHLGLSSLFSPTSPQSTPKPAGLSFSGRSKDLGIDRVEWNGPDLRGTRSSLGYAGGIRGVGYARPFV